MNLLLFNLATDREHVTLAFGLRWIEKLATHFDRIDIVTMYEGKHELPANVYVVSAGRERGYSLARRIVRFYILTFGIVRRHKPRIAFAHMIPEFSILFRPLSLLFGIPSILWYAHGHVPRNLRIALPLVDHVISSTPEGFRLDTGKVTFIGQGIDDTIYGYRPRTASDKPRLVTVGRLAASKGQDLLLQALQERNAGGKNDWQLTIIGGPTCSLEEIFAEKLYQQAKKFSEGQIIFQGRLDAQPIADILADSDLSISLSATGSLDKTIVESMAAGCPVIGCNDAFRTIAETDGFSDCIAGTNAVSINSALDLFLAKTPEERATLAQKQAFVARRDHTLDGLIERLVKILKQFAKDKP